MITDLDEAGSPMANTTYLSMDMGSLIINVDNHNSYPL